MITMKKKSLMLIIFSLMLLACFGMIGTAFAENNTIATAAQINTNTDITDYLRTTSYVNVYKFTLPVDGYISVTFSHDYVNDSSSVWNMNILNQDSVSYMTASYTGLNISGYTTNNIGLPAGTWYIRITPVTYHASTANYTFKVNYTESAYWETELNNIPTTADNIQTGMYYNGSLAGNCGDDWFKFAIPSDGYITVDFAHAYWNDSSSVWNLGIFDTNSQNYITFSYNGITTSELTTTKLGLAAGTYYVKISPVTYHQSGVDYRFRVNFTASTVWEKEFNGGLVTSNSILVDTTYYGLLMSGSDTDWFSFTQPAPGFVYFSFMHDFYNDTSSNWVAQILDRDSVEIFRGSYIGTMTTEDVSDRIQLDAGEYYVRIYPTSYHHSAAQYWFRVLSRNPEEIVTPTPSSDPTEIPTETPTAQPEQMDIADSKINTIKDQIYTGYAITPGVSVKYAGRKLVENTDYILSYQNNINVGEATAVIAGIGNYTGISEKTFVIKPKTVTIQSLKASKKKLTVRWEQGNGITGYEIEYSLKKSFSDSSKKTIKKSSTIQKVISGLKAGKKYYIRIRAFTKVGGKKYYSAWSPVKSKKVK